MGADRIGHAVILGLTGEQLQKLAPDRIGKSKRSREAFDLKREQLIERLKARGVVVELNITSNLVISNLTIDLHSAATLAAKGVRVSVSTDDELLLHTDVAEEMHRYAQIKGVGVVEVAMAGLEAFASRLGTWELTRATTLQDEWRKTIMSITPESARNATIDAVITRFLGAKVLEEARKLEAGQRAKPPVETSSAKPGEQPQTPLQKTPDDALRYVFR
jgi:hypothetical protein